jgi:DNA-binding transcriptional LysR family regulator
MPGRPLPLSALRAFDAAARHRSISGAARELGVAQPSVSEQIRLLEARLGAPLFDRLPGGLALTPRGLALSVETAPAFGALRRAMGEAEECAGELRLCLFPTVAFRWLAPRLPLLAAALPGLRLRIETVPSWSPGLLRLHDVTSRFGVGDWPGLRSVRLAEDRLVPVTAPGSARERAGRPRIRCARRPEAWELYGGGVRRAGARPALAVDTNHLATALAEAGAGVALTPLAFVEAEMRAGRLVQEGAVSDPGGRGYHLVARAGSGPAARFLDWVAGQAGG